MGNKLLTAALVAGLSATAMIVAPSAGAADSPTWCGSWLANPAKATNVSAVSGTQTNVGGSTYIRVNQGTYNGKWFAWAKMYNEGFDVVALIWVNQADKAIYQCGSRDGSSGWSGDSYTAGVDDAHAYKVQAKYRHSQVVVYGPAVVWR
jgi:hypothetical protein